MTTPKVLIYCPLNPSTPKLLGRTMKSIFAMTWNAPVDVVFGRHDHGPLDKEASYEEITAKYNHARALALAGGYDYLLTVEADMILPELALERLTRLDADVAYGLYVSRHGRHQWLAYMKVNEDGTGASITCDESYVKPAWGQVVDVEGVGLGCTLISRRVLEAVPFRREKSNCANDWFFALDVKRAGFRQVCDLGVVCGHMAMHPSPRIYWPDPEAKDFYREEFLTQAEPVQQQTIIIDRPGIQKVYAMEAQ